MTKKSGGSTFSCAGHTVGRAENSNTTVATTPATNTGVRSTDNVPCIVLPFDSTLKPFLSLGLSCNNCHQASQILYERQTSKSDSHDKYAKSAVCKEHFCPTCVEHMSSKMFAMKNCKTSSDVSTLRLSTSEGSRFFGLAESLTKNIENIFENACLSCHRPLLEETMDSEEYCFPTNCPHCGVIYCPCCKSFIRSSHISASVPDRKELQLEPHEIITLHVNKHHSKLKDALLIGPVPRIEKLIAFSQVARFERLRNVYSADLLRPLFSPGTAFAEKACMLSKALEVQFDPNVLFSSSQSSGLGGVKEGKKKNWDTYEREDQLLLQYLHTNKKVLVIKRDEQEVQPQCSLRKQLSRGVFAILNLLAALAGFRDSSIPVPFARSSQTF
mmetsp:Transcript_16172/g.40912  ORF Transcript_16172/g.40912 Transcript_16172/m.40912 type:complete len:386 (-) Transcript_16172:137-1294(-)